MGSPTKDSTIIIDPWELLASVSGGNVKVGATRSLSTSYAQLLAIDVAILEATAQQGIDIRVEISYNGIWKTYAEYTSSAVTGAVTTLDLEAASGQKVLGIPDGTAVGIIFDKVFIRDNTDIADSEVGTIVAQTVGTMTMADNLANTHAVTVTTVSTGVDQWIVDLPMACDGVRTNFNNADADCDVAISTSLTVVTNLAA